MIDLGIDKLLNKEEDFKNFPIDVFPEQVTEYMCELRDKIGCNPNYMAGAFITAISICIGRSKSLIIRDVWREWCVFWPVIIGEAGSKKTPSTSPFLKPIRQIESELYKKYLKDIENHTEDVTIPKPTEPRLYVGDATIEAYVQTHSQNPRGVAIILDEISGLVTNSGKYNKGSDIEKYLQAFSYSDISATRKGAGMSSRLYHPFLNIFGGIQPQILTSLMTDQLKDNGFWDRFLFISGNFQTGKMTKEDISSDVANNYDSYITGMFELVKQTEPYDRTEDLSIDSYRMNKEASDCWFDYNSIIEDLISEHSQLSSQTKSAYSKMATYFGRFILLFHMLDSVYLYPFQRLRFCEVQIGSVEKAIRIVKYFMNQFDEVSKDVSAEKEAKNILFDSKGMSIEEKVKLLISKDPSISDRQISRILKISPTTAGKYRKPLN